MATYKSYLFNMVTDNGSSIEITEKDGALVLAINYKYYKVLRTFRNMDTLQNFISSFSKKGLSSEGILDKLAQFLTYNEVNYYG